MVLLTLAVLVGGAVLMALLLDMMGYLHSPAMVNNLGTME
jgi:uncharacterized membrane protein YdcZ (DUF606 family)